MRWICLVGLSLAACMPSAAEQNNVANLYLTEGQSEVAILAYQAALAQEPENGTLYFNLAAAYGAQQTLEAAQQALQQAILRGDRALQAQAYFNLGNLYFTNLQFSEAIRAYQQALLLNPDDEHSRHNLELALLYQAQATPTPMEMRTQPEIQQADPNASPSPNPSGQNLPTPSPPPPLDIGGGTPEVPQPDDLPESDTRSTPRPGEGTLTVEEANEIIDTILNGDTEQRNLRPDLRITPQTPVGKDW